MGWIPKNIVTTPDNNNDIIDNIKSQVEDLIPQKCETPCDIESILAWWGFLITIPTSHNWKDYETYKLFSNSLNSNINIQYQAENNIFVFKWKKISQAFHPNTFEALYASK